MASVLMGGPQVGSHCTLNNFLLSWEDLHICQNVLVMKKISFQGKETKILQFIKGEKRVKNNNKAESN